LADSSEVLTASVVALMIEETSTSETSVNAYQNTRRNIPEDSHRRTRRPQFSDVHGLRGVKTEVPVVSAEMTH
jgi:hypothetical protein